MCIVIDTNTLHLVFDESTEDHKHFRPVFEWIVNGKGKMVWGGSKYYSEVSKARKYLGILKQLRDSRKVAFACDEEVDRREREIVEANKDPDFDDAHIVALVCISKCKVVCSEDSRSYQHLKNKTWYPKGIKPPKIYNKKSSKKAEEIINDKNISEICQPCVKLNKEIAKKIKM